MKKTLPDNTSAATQGTPPLQSAIVIGQRLKKARQESNADLKNLAARLKVSESKLVAMEEGTLAMPHLIFLRGMLRSYAKVLGVDINAELAELGSAGEGAVALPEQPQKAATPPTTPKKAAIAASKEIKKTPALAQKSQTPPPAPLEQTPHTAPEPSLPPRTHKLLLWLMLGILFSGSAIYLIAEQVKNNEDVTPSTSAIIDTVEQSSTLPLPVSEKPIETYPQHDLSAAPSTPVQKLEAQSPAKVALPNNRIKERNPAANPRVLSLSNPNQIPPGQANTDTAIIDGIIVKPITSITTTNPIARLPETATSTTIDKAPANPSARLSEATAPATTDKAPANPSARPPEAAAPATIDKTPINPSKTPANPSAPSGLKEEQLDSKTPPTIDNMMLNRLTNTMPRLRTRTTQPMAEKAFMHALKSPPTMQPLLSIKFNGNSWYAISDANGKVLASGAGQPGDVQQIRGTAPIKIALGNTQSVEEIEFRGKHVYLEKIQSGVARLNLK